jgi:hypothetical protein
MNTTKKDEWLEVHTDRNYVCIPSFLFKKLKVRECVVLSNLVLQQKQTNQTSFIYPHHMQIKDLGLSEHEIKQSKKILKKKKFISTTKEGMPSMEYYTINYSEIFK